METAPCCRFGRVVGLGPVAALALVCLASASCGSQSLSGGSGTPSTSSVVAVVSGSVVAGPSCPVESASHPCPPRPLAGVLVEAVAASSGGTVSSGKVSAKARTADDGSFSLTVPAGAYDVEVGSSGPYPRCRPVTVTLSRGAHHHLVISCDTGIR